MDRRTVAGCIRYGAVVTETVSLGAGSLLRFNHGLLVLVKASRVGGCPGIGRALYPAADPLCGGCVGGAGMTPRSQLQGIRTFLGALFQWDFDPAASEYHLNSVPDKKLLDHAFPKPPPIGIGVVECSGPLPFCVDPDALIDPEPVLFYQALSACGPSASEEGPVF